MKQTSKDRRLGIISVVHEGRRPFGMQTYFFEDMVKNGGVEDTRLFFFSPMDWKEGSDEVSGFQSIDNEWTEVKESIPEVLYDRAFSKDSNQKTYIDGFRQFLSETKKTILNPFGLADLLNNKTVFHDFLQEHDIATLGTYPIDLIKEEGFFDEISTSKVYLKPVFGSKGEGIFVIEKSEKAYFLFDNLGKKETYKSYSQLIERLDSLIEFSKDYFIQEEAKTQLYEDAPFDIRVLVQNYGNEYKVTGKAVRIGQKKSMTSNLNNGGNALPLEELPSFFEKHYMYSIEKLHLIIDKLCLDCSHVLKNEIGDFCEIGFDILVTRDKGPIIIEGNAKPSRWVFVKMADYLDDMGKDNSYYLDRRKETVSVPVKYALYLIDQKR